MECRKNFTLTAVGGEVATSISKKVQNRHVNGVRLAYIDASGEGDISASDTVTVTLARNQTDKVLINAIPLSFFQQLTDLENGFSTSLTTMLDSVGDAYITANMRVIDIDLGSIHLSGNDELIISLGNANSRRVRAWTFSDSLAPDFQLEYTQTNDTDKVFHDVNRIYLLSSVGLIDAGDTTNYMIKCSVNGFDSFNEIQTYICDMLIDYEVETLTVSSSKIVPIYANLDGLQHDVTINVTGNLPAANLSLVCVSEFREGLQVEKSKQLTASAYATSIRNLRSAAPRKIQALQLAGRVPTN